MTHWKRRPVARAAEGRLTKLRSPRARLTAQKGFTPRLRGNTLTIAPRRIPLRRGMFDGPRGVPVPL